MQQMRANIMVDYEFTINKHFWVIIGNYKISNERRVD